MAVILRLLKVAFDILDFAATLFGGWPIFGGLIVAAVTGAWAVIWDYGPLSVIAAAYAAAIGMIAFDYGGMLLARFRRTSEDLVRKAANFRELTQRVQDIIRIGEGGLNIEAYLGYWQQDVLEAMKDEAFDEYYGFESMPLEGKVNKLRLITMRFSKEHKISAADVLALAEREGIVSPYKDIDLMA